ncbi:MAG: carboxypeptidase-like regulatory domain-containing protein [Tannerellaceae bacterium]|jgi:hypothetical protein|nr:carboxypeptidase-like regulatory domain-containing protein [Tannerellaceae bacterium]
MTIKTFISFLFVLLSIDSYTQICIQGVTKDRRGKIIEYVSIGFQEKGIGTISDHQGTFLLNIPDSLQNDSLTFHHVSYNTVLLLPQDVNRDSIIRMEEKITALPEISVVPKKISTKWLNRGFKIPGAYAFTENLGEEWGISLKIKRQAILKQVQFEIKTCTYDSVKLRINIYKFNSDTQEVGEYLLSEPLYKTVEKYTENKKITVDIPGLISVNQEQILLSFEFVQFFGEGHIHYPVYKGNENNPIQAAVYGEIIEIG